MFVGFRNQGAGKAKRLFRSRGVKAVTPQGVLPLYRSMFKVTREPVVGSKRHFSGRRVVGLVTNHEARIGNPKQLRIAHWPAPQVTGQIDQNTLSVGIPLAEPHMPFGPAKAINEGSGAFLGNIRWQPEFVPAQKLRQGCKQFAAKQSLNNLGGQEVAATRRQPGLVGKTTIGDQRVDMGMQRQGARPGVKRQQQPRACAKIAGISKQFEQRLSRRLEQGIGHSLSVKAPPGEQFMGEGKDDVMVRAGQQPFGLPCQPVIPALQRAAGAKPMLATVPDNSFGFSAGATIKMPTQLRTPAARNQRCGTMLMQGQPVLTGVVREMFANDRGNRSFHAAIVSPTHQQCSIPTAQPGKFNVKLSGVPESQSRLPSPVHYVSIRKRRSWPCFITTPASCVRQRLLVRRLRLPR